MSEFVPLVFPEWITWGQRRGASLPESKDGLCRWCHKPVANGRRSWCSGAHIRAFQRVFSWGDLRRYIIERDKVCRRCGVGHPGWKKGRGVHKRAFVYVGFRERGYHAEFCDLFEAWDVDHIIPVRSGGTDNPENLRLLCAKCHIAVGYEQRAVA